MSNDLAQKFGVNAKQLPAGATVLDFGRDHLGFRLFDRPEDWPQFADQIDKFCEENEKGYELKDAYYAPDTDSIHLPNRDRFSSGANYYAFLLHELGHWTGHQSRLNLALKHPFGSHGYAREELRAEIASLIAGWSWESDTTQASTQLCPGMQNFAV